MTTTQLSLFAAEPPLTPRPFQRRVDAAVSELTGPHFDGATYDPAADQQRLSTQLGRVWAALADGQWWTLAQLAQHVGGSEAGVSARLGDMRKSPKHGQPPAWWQGHTVERRRVAGVNGLWQYRLIRRAEVAA